VLRGEPLGGPLVHLVLSLAFRGGLGKHPRGDHRRPLPRRGQPEPERRNLVVACQRVARPRVGRPAPVQIANHLFAEPCVARIQDGGDARRHHGDAERLAAPLARGELVDRALELLDLPVEALAVGPVQGCDGPEDVERASQIVVRLEPFREDQVRVDGGLDAA
jgi:hypothetical protein